MNGTTLWVVRGSEVGRRGLNTLTSEGRPQKTKSYLSVRIKNMLEIWDKGLLNS